MSTYRYSRSQSWSPSNSGLFLKQSHPQQVIHASRFIPHPSTGTPSVGPSAALSSCHFIRCASYAAAHCAQEHPPVRSTAHIYWCPFVPVSALPRRSPHQSARATVCPISTNLAFLRRQLSHARSRKRATHSPGITRSRAPPDFNHLSSVPNPLC